MSPQNTRSICALGADDLGADDAEGNVLEVLEYFNESTGQIEKNGLFMIPADAYRDKNTMEWIMAVKDVESETDMLYNDFVAQRHNEYAATGGLKGIRKLFVEQTGYANVGNENEIKLSLLKNNTADDTLIEMTHTYG